MSELDKIRENINSIDEQMAQLFQERMEMSRQVAAFKKDRGLSIRDAERERELIDRDRRFIKDPAVDGYYVQFLRSILDLSCAYQSRLLNGMKVAYSGVEGAYGYIAARRMFPEAQLIAYPDFAAAHRAVEQGEADSAVLPLENSYAGEVGAVMDLLFSGELYINQVMDLEIDHSLLGVEGAAVDTVRTVVSHPQALRQCDEQIEMMRDEYNRRRRYVVKALNDMGLTCFEPRGAFYVFPSIQISGLTSSEFCEQLLREKEVAIIPGSAFGASGEGYARISYAYSVDHLQIAMKRIREFLSENGWTK